ncbi:MAG: YoaP domain-containing protein [Bacteroidales bacterium]|nr:YoaP domain-containing protein [Bacteroidales bacterium]MCF8458400.1 YoaP domain-containing protein [Bacteroidales bacterium]
MELERTPQIISLSPDNIDKEHICCAFADKKCSHGYLAKKDWLNDQFKIGYTFKKFDVRGKVFIEYVPAEHAWLPVDAPGYLLINCFWVSGQYKGMGFGKLLLDECIRDSHGKAGIIVVTGGKKRPFMSDSRFLKHQGFIKVDEAAPYFELWCKKNYPGALDPKFLDSAKQARCENKNGIVVYYSNTCPFNEYYVNTVLKDFAKMKNIPLDIIEITSQQTGRNMPVPWIIHSLFYNGEYLTHELKSEKGLEKLFGKLV